VSRENASRDAFVTQQPPLACIVPAVEWLHPVPVKAVAVITSRPIADIEELPFWTVKQGKLQLFHVRSAAHPQPAAIKGFPDWNVFGAATVQEDAQRLRDKLKPYFQ